MRNFKKLREFDEKINLSEVEESRSVNANEIPPHEKAKLALAYWVLAFCSAFMLFAWYIKTYYPTHEAALHCNSNNIDFCKSQADKLFTYSKEAAEGIFDFAKTWIPPIITLVLGYYFGRSDIDRQN